MASTSRGAAATARATSRLAVLCAARLASIASDSTTSSLPFDCLAGSFNWEEGWSDEKKVWCCKHGSKGCSTTGAPVPAAASTTAEAPRPATARAEASTTSANYDCMEGWFNWRSGWSLGKKTWCCEHAHKGCYEKEDETTTTMLDFDCSAGLDTWEKLWSREKQHWCCEHESRGCAGAVTPAPTLAAPAPPPRPAPPADLAAKFPASGCLSLCTVLGIAAPCRARVRYASSHEFGDQPNACAKALVRVIEQCSNCATCALAETGCHDVHEEDVGKVRAPEHAGHSESTEPPAATAACDHSCLYKNRTATCRERVIWSANHKFLGRANACREAWRCVQDECPSCADCPLAHTGCLEHTAVGPPLAVTALVTASPKSTQLFDCLAGYSNWERAWSPDKRKWCCEREQRGCDAQMKEGSIARTTVPFDCLAGLSNWKIGWSKLKRKWCFCEQDKIPLSRDNCPEAEPVKFDCDAGRKHWEDGWSQKKKAWCCSPRHGGCPKPVAATTTEATDARRTEPKEKPRHAHDCHKDLATWSTSWSPEKKDWCCKKEEVHCNPLPQMLVVKTERWRPIAPTGGRLSRALVAAAVAVAVGGATVALVMFGSRLSTQRAKRRGMQGLPQEADLLPFEEDFAE